MKLPWERPHPGLKECLEALCEIERQRTYAMLPDSVADDMEALVYDYIRRLLK